MKKSLFILVFLLIASIVVNVLLWKQTQVEERREIYIDTIAYRRPVPVDSLVVRYVTEKLPLADNLNEPIDTVSVDTLVTVGRGETKDSIEVVLPITQKVYEDSTYRAYVSGYHPALDSINIFRRNEVVYIRSPTKPKRWSIGIQVGYGITPRRAEPYIGIGISYDLFTF